MKISNLAPLGEWPECKVQGMQLEANAYQRADGSRYVFFREPGEQIAGDALGVNSTKVVYRTNGDETIFLGMLIKRAHRGRGMGKELIKYFMDAVSESGSEFSGTGTINKPVIALCLDRAGLRPVSDRFVVDILPKSAHDTTGTPKVLVVKNELQPEDIVDNSMGGKFYEVVPDFMAARAYPLNIADTRVALHTPYAPL